MVAVTVLEKRILLICASSKATGKDGVDALETVDVISKEVSVQSDGPPHPRARARMVTLPVKVVDQLTTPVVALMDPAVGSVNSYS